MGTVTQVQFLYLVVGTFQQNQGRCKEQFKHAELVAAALKFREGWETAKIKVGELILGTAECGEVF